MMLRVSSQLSSSRPLDLLSLSFYFTATFSYNNITHISVQAWLIPAERCRRSWWPAPAVPCTRRGRPGPAPPPPPAPPLRLGAGQLAQAGSPHCTVGNWGGPHLLSDLLLQVIKTNFLLEKMKLKNGQQIWILIGFCIRQTLDRYHVTPQSLPLCSVLEMFPRTHLTTGQISQVFVIT